MTRSLADIAAGNWPEDDETQKRTAWDNADWVPGTSYKVDCDGRYMLWTEYGKRSMYGWQIDHAFPSVFGGLTVGANLRARHWRGNAEAGGTLAGMGQLFGYRL